MKLGDGHKGVHSVASLLPDRSQNFLSKARVPHVSGDVNLIIVIWICVKTHVVLESRWREVRKRRIVLECSC